jgi:hypothetical protein
MANRVPFDKYAARAANEVMVLHSPGDWVRLWIEQWGRPTTLATVALDNADALHKKADALRKKADEEGRRAREQDR